MAYCVRCGVELDKQLNSCPLCATPVHLPEELDEGAQKTYPERIQRKGVKQINLVPSKTFVYLMTFIIIIPLIVCLMVDVRRNNTISWSFYPVTSLILFWILIAYPALIKRYSLLKILTIDIYSIVFFLISLNLFSGGFLSWSIYPVASLLLIWVYFLLGFLFGRTHPVFMLVVSYISTGLYLYLIEQATGRIWFFALALPVLTLIFIIVLITILLSSLKFFTGPSLIGLLFCNISVFCIGAELIISKFVFDNGFSLFWSLIVTGVCLPVGIFLIFVQKNDEFRIYLQKKFHL